MSLGIISSLQRAMTSVSGINKAKASNADISTDKGQFRSLRCAMMTVTSFVTVNAGGGGGLLPLPAPDSRLTMRCVHSGTACSWVEVAVRSRVSMLTADRTPACSDPPTGAAGLLFARLR
eukprot:TRINITY_DN11550_c0_g1_i1.p4 TRINITY_DN11550_c0_g1~~TRINITY_DN11550_c0_g1_i1.p4  ORF type:complete len:120 (-),score=13.96 TRINITY_DN11550_c0_g1_i1:475-834(-)